MWAVYRNRSIRSVYWCAWFTRCYRECGSTGISLSLEYYWRFLRRLWPYCRAWYPCTGNRCNPQDSSQDSLNVLTSLTLHLILSTDKIQCVYYWFTKRDVHSRYARRRVIIGLLTSSRTIFSMVTQIRLINKRAVNSWHCLSYDDTTILWNVVMGTRIFS